MKSRQQWIVGIIRAVARRYGWRVCVQWSRSRESAYLKLRHVGGVKCAVRVSDHQNPAGFGGLVNIHREATTAETVRQLVAYLVNVERRFIQENAWFGEWYDV